MKRSVLIVDDDSSDLGHMKCLLEEQGWEVIAVSNGAHALDVLKKHRVNLILLDILMPTLSGYDLLTLLHHRYNGDMKILFVSIVPKKEVDLSHVDGFIQKPFTKEQFINAVTDILER